MIRTIVLFPLLAFILISSGFGSFWELYTENLKEDITFQQQSLRLMSAEQGYKQYEDFFQPYVTFGTGKGNGMIFNEEGLKSSSFGLNANLLHVFGTDIGLSIPFSYVKDRKSSNGESQEDFKIENISMNISRDLISEDNADKLQKKADMLSASFTLNQAAWTVFIGTVKSIFDIRYNRELLLLYEKKSDIYSELMEEATDSDNRRNYEKMYLNAEKLRIGVESIMLELSKYEVLTDEDVDSIYGEILLLIPDMYENSVEKDIFLRNDIRSLALSKQAAEEKAELWFLPYFPNPHLTFTPSFNVADPELDFEDRFSWSLSVQCDMTLFDRGEMESESISRKGNAEIKKLEYSQKTDSLEKKIESLHLEEKKSMLDYEIKQIDYQIVKESYERNQKLYKKGYITQNDMKLSEIEFIQKKLDYEKAFQQLLMDKLNIMKETVDTPGGY